MYQYNAYTFIFLLCCCKALASHLLIQSASLSWSRSIRTEGLYMVEKLYTTQTATVKFFFIKKNHQQQQHSNNNSNSHTINYYWTRFCGGLVAVANVLVDRVVFRFIIISTANTMLTIKSVDLKQWVCSHRLYYDLQWFSSFCLTFRKYSQPIERMNE